MILGQAAVGAIIFFLSFMTITVASQNFDERPALFIIIAIINSAYWAFTIVRELIWKGLL